MIYSQRMHIFILFQYDEASLVEAIALAGPVSIAYQVAKDFRLYKDGVYSR